MVAAGQITEIKAGQAQAAACSAGEQVRQASVVALNEGDLTEQPFPLQPRCGGAQGDFLDINGEDTAVSANSLGQKGSIPAIAGGGIQNPVTRANMLPPCGLCDLRKRDAAHASGRG